MSQNNNGNNELSGIMLPLALVGAGMMLLAALVYALLLFGAFVLTLIALCAWNKPLTIGTMTLEPDEARAFIGRGLIGAFVLPAFVIFCELVFGIRVNGDYLPHLIFGGYALGSLGVAMLEASNEAETGQTIEHLPAPPSAQIAPPKGFIPPGFIPPAKPGFISPGTGSAPSDSAPPFRFARWDDEEERS